MKLSNAVALFHVLILPFVIFFVSMEVYFLAVLLLVSSILLDAVDKVYYRKREKVHSFIHPFSDKIIILSLLFTFTLLGYFSSLVLLIFILRDIIVAVIRILASRDDLMIKGGWYGKAINMLQFILVFVILLRESYDITFLEMELYLLTLVIISLLIVSVIRYGYLYGKRLKTRKILGKKVEHEKMVILANRKSGGFKNRYRRRLLRIFSRKRKAPIIYLPENKNMYAGIDKKIKKYKEVVIAGGDGSFESALNYKPLQKKILGFFPLGAGNLYYSYFYKGKRFEYLRSRFKFHVVDLDILEIEWDDKKLQTTLLGVGVDAEVIRRIKDKKNHSFSDYFFSSAEIAFSGYKAKYDLECEVDGRKYRWGNTINLTVGKVPYIGFALRALLGRVRDDDGMILGTACVNTHSPFLNKPLRLWAILLTQLNLGRSPLLPLKGKEFIIRSNEPFPLQAGGEFLGYTKLVRVKVKRKQKVLMI